MNSSKTFDDVIRYLERVIADGGEIDYQKIASIAMSPAPLFQRIFTFVSGISIADYVRKRKLTLAGNALKGGGISVTDVAMQYGFGSHSAFSRAFKEHHGITPSEANRQGAKLNEYPPIQYLDMRFVGGRRIMAELKKIVYKETPGRLMVGMHRETSFWEAGNVWQDFFAGNTVDSLDTLAAAKCCGDIDANVGIGMMYHFRDMQSFDFIVGDFVRVGTPIPDGLFAKHIPAGWAAHIQIEGANVAEILDSAYLLITEAIEKTGYAIDQDHFYWCEVYTNERYCEPLNRGERVTIDYILPVKADGE